LAPHEPRSSGRFAETSAALDELTELDPALPEIPLIAAELQTERGASDAGA
jgi:hypothetical protein